MIIAFDQMFKVTIFFLECFLYFQYIHMLLKQIDVEESFSISFSSSLVINLPYFIFEKLQHEVRFHFLNTG